jgi:uncharacterized RDD family membrane protein YckC
MERETKLNFKPLSEGLGFHPFSDGLPYAPISKANTGTTQSGSGATAAGTPTIARSAPRISVPTARSTSPRTPLPHTPQSHSPMSQPSYSHVPQPHAPASHSPIAHAPIAHAPVAAPQPAPAPAAQISSHITESAHPGILYVGKRVLAYSLDSLLNLSLCMTALSAVLLQQDLPPESLFTPGVILIAFLFASFFNWALIAAQEVAFGTTIGKRIFGLTLTGSASALFLRAFFFLPSAGFGGIGLLWALFNRRRRCWHDMVVDTQPFENAQL